MRIDKDSLRFPANLTNLSTMGKYGRFENDRASKLSNDPKSCREDKPRRRSQNNSVGAFAKTPLFPHLRNGLASQTIDQPRSIDLIFFPHISASF